MSQIKCSAKQTPWSANRPRSHPLIRVALPDLRNAVSAWHEISLTTEVFLFFSLHLFLQKKICSLPSVPPADLSSRPHCPSSRRSSLPPPHATEASLPYFPSARQMTERTTANSLFSLAPLRLTHRRLISRTPGTASRFRTVASTVP